MNPLEFWLGVLSVLGIVVVAPAWMYWAGAGLTGVPAHIEWLVALVLPFTVLMLLASWTQSWRAS